MRNKMAKKKEVLLLLLLLAASSAVGAAAAVLAGRSRRAVDSSDEITIYLDHTNEVYVRMMVALYDNLSQVAQYSGETDKYPEISWNLVDKSGLTAEDYRAELLSELETGEGPDLIFLDEYSCESPEFLMKNGYFAELDPWLDSGMCVWQESDFLTGTMEAGQMDGSQYIIPVSVDIPVLCSTREQLERAGIWVEDLNGTGAILTAAAAYYQQTGNFPFTSGSFLKNLELYIGEKEGWSRELESSMDILLGVSKEDKGIYAGAEEFLGGEVLFLTRGVDDYRGMAVQLGFLPEDEELLFLPLTRTDGNMQAVIRQAVAVNKNSGNRSGAYAALNAFYQENIMNYSAGLPVIVKGTLWSGLFEEGFSWFTESKERMQGVHDLTQSNNWQYQRMTKKLVKTAVYPVFSLPEGDGTGNSSGRVMSVMLPDLGLREESALYQWIAAAAKRLEDEAGIHVELGFCSSEKLLLADRASDVTVFYFYMPYYLKRSDFEAHVFDYRKLLPDSLLSELDWKDGILERAEEAPVMGIPFTQDQTWLNSFVISAETEFPEEVMQLIAYCLTSEAYGELLEKYGEESVLGS